MHKNCLLNVLIVLTVLLFAVSPLQADADKPEMRRVEVKSIDFQIDVPTSWQITLNERLRGTAFFKAQGTTLDGRIIPATLSAIYMEPEAGKRFPELPEPEAYAEIFTGMLKQNQIEFELVRSVACSIGGYEGVLVEYTQMQNEIMLRTIQMNLTPPDGSDRFIVTYGTVEQTAAVDIPFLKKLIEGIRLGEPQ